MTTMMMQRSFAASVLWILTILVFNTMAWSFSNQLLAITKGNLALINSVQAGVEIGYEECQSQFKWDLWNCPKEAFDVFDRPGSRAATREKAFVHAIISAGITYTLTRNCSLGHFDNCMCDQTRKATNDNRWTWGGCSDNIKFGEKQAKEFFDKREPATDTGAINLHNNRVGRWAVKRTMRRMCKCHGVSGSCAVSTCWMRLGDMHTVGNRLRKAYERAQLLEYNGGTTLGIYERDSENDGLIRRRRLPFKKGTLIYSFDSTNYCNGTISTLGRECSQRSGVGVTKNEAESCNRLCHDCGLDIRRERKTQNNTCKCRFIWCCKVECQSCSQEVERTFCA